MKKENIEKIWLTEDAVYIKTIDGKEAKEYFADYPNLKNATESQLKNYKISVFGIHWEELDEDLSFEGFFRNNEKRTA